MVLQDYGFPDENRVTCPRQEELAKFPHT